MSADRYPSPFDTSSAEGASPYLFHYTSIDKLASIALTRSIALSPLFAMNDPKEAINCPNIGFEAHSPEERRTSGTSAAEQDAEFKALWGSIRIACFTEELVDASQHLEREDQRGYAHSRMWAQYADAHRGVCLVLLKEALLDSADSKVGLHHGPIRYHFGYLPRPMTDRNGSVAEQHDSQVVTSLFRKNRDWAAEREFRILVTGWHDAPCLVNLEGCVAALVVGISLPHHHWPTVTAAADALGLTSQMIRQIRYEEGVLIPRLPSDPA